MYRVSAAGAGEGSACGVGAVGDETLQTVQAEDVSVAAGHPTGVCGATQTDGADLIRHGPQPPPAPVSIHAVLTM